METLHRLQSLNFSLEKARRLQITLSKRIICRDCFETPIKYIAGIDVAYAYNQSIGAVAVLEYDSMKLVELETSKVTTRFPYIPTLLSFREVPPAASAIKKLRIKPDVFLVDGQGIAHPYRLGFASHLGLVLDIATVGVAKTLLFGRITESESGFWRPVIHDGKIVGGAVSTKLNARPIYVSVGHKVSLETAVKIVLECSRKHRIPEPIREAHMIAEKIKREYMSK
ncbi:deoxyribonuclease V [Candidatus Bathyarchaeota archaeon]|nr:deoxyribonuclease V [Candidatus Bathyarchaeota archaeon]